MSIAIQLTPNPLEPARAEQQREHFRQHVASRAQARSSRTILLEPDTRQASLLRDVYAQIGDVEVVEVTLVNDGKVPTADLFRVSAPGYDGPLATNVSALRRRFPAAGFETVKVSAMTLDRVFEQFATIGPIEFVSVDAATEDLARLATSTHLDRVQAIAIDWDECLQRDDQVAEQVIRLRSKGFVPAGRPWGEAGEAVLLTRPSSVSARASAALQQARARAGEAVVTARDSWFGPSQRAKLVLPFRVATSRDLMRADILDDNPTTSLPQLPLRVVESAISRAEAREPKPWSPPALPLDEPWALAQECQSRHGVWPISFSYPRPAWAVNPAPTDLISPITPGLPYSFEDEDSYRRTYSDAIWGVTHRKAGWDCFRHVEIMGAGATPWMLDVTEIPRFSMVHYPKRSLAMAAQAMNSGPIRPGEDFRQHVRRHFEQHLTSEAMALYLLRAAGKEGAQRVLFVDERLPHHADYQSMLTLIGLKQILGVNCHVLFPVDYIYDDTEADTTALYGRGFGYTRVVPSASRSTTERSRSLGADDFDAIIVGSVTRNEALAKRLLSDYPSSKTIWIHGEDLPPAVGEAADYRRSRVHMFVRAIHANT